MSGLLQRLAGQALGASATSVGPSRIHAAASVHAQVPVALPAKDESPLPNLQIFPAPRAVDTARSARTPEESDFAVRAAPDSSQSTSVFLHAIHEAPPVRPTAAPQSHAGAPLVEEVRLARARVQAVPPRLLEEVEPTSLVAPAITPVAPAPQFPMNAAHSTASAENTEVHVHIGRIEVIAVHEAAAPKKKSTSTPRETLPLADYLARRRSS